MIINTLKYLGLIILLLVTSAVYAAKPTRPPEPEPVPDGCYAAIDSLPYEITEEGVYCFIGNLSTSVATGNAITISIDNVTIDMKSWKLDGSGAGAGTTSYGIKASPVRNITIRNGTIKGFFRGIHLDDVSPYINSQGHLIENIRAVENTTLGFWVEGSGSIIRHSQVINTGNSSVFSNAGGIRINGTGVRVLNNDIYNVQADDTGATIGIYVEYAKGAVIDGNRIDSITSSAGDTYGIDVVESTDVLVRGNSITNVDYGVYYLTFQTTSTGKYMDNLTSGVTTPFTGGTDAGDNN